MDKNKKFLKQITDAERIAVGSAVANILAGSKTGLNIRKLEGYTHIYRVRIGRIRIVYEKTDTTIIIVKIGFKGENFYKL